MSRNPERIDLILGEIRRIWNQHPDMSLGQIIDPFHTEDDVLLAGLLNYGKENK